jgi:hypothetical protein
MLTQLIAPHNKENARKLRSKFVKQFIACIYERHTHNVSLKIKKEMYLYKTLY